MHAPSPCMGSRRCSGSRRDVEPLLHGRAGQAAFEPGGDVLIVAEADDLRRLVKANQVADPAPSLSWPPASLNDRDVGGFNRLDRSPKPGSTRPACPAWHGARARYPHGSRLHGRRRATEILSARWSAIRASSAHAPSAESLPPACPR